VAYLLMILMSIIVSVGQILVKGGVNLQEAKGLSPRQGGYYLSLPLVAGGVLVMAAPLIYLEVVHRLGLSGAFGLNGLTYLMIYGMGLLILKEKSSLLQTAGVLLIVMGMVVWSI